MAKKLKKFFRDIMVYLSFALKRTEEQTLRQSGTSGEVGVGDEQQVNENRVSKALLKGEVTQEVKMLRYRTYKVDEEAKEHEYFSPMKSVKRDKQDNRHIKYKNIEGCKLILIQPNKPKTLSLEDAIKMFENKSIEPDSFTITIKRNFVPRFKLEEYTKRIALFSCPNGKTIADFYVSKYSNPSDFKSKAFVREMESVIKNGRKSDITDFSSFSFETYKCYNSEDFQEYTLRKCRLVGFDEYDGNYIFRYETDEEPKVVNNRLSDVYYDAEMDRRYKNKEKKALTIDFNPYSDVNKREYICDKCGKKFVYDLGEIDAEEPCEARLVDEEYRSDGEVTNYLDIEMTEQATGIRLCKDCLQKEYERLVAEMAKDK